MKHDGRVALGALLLTLLIILHVYGSSAARSVEEDTVTPAPEMSTAAQACYDCHARATANLVHRKQDGEHMTSAVDCFSCHDAAGKGDRVDIKNHFGYSVVTLVTLEDCAPCHPRETPVPR